jgi:hypothetical protein
MVHLGKDKKRSVAQAGVNMAKPHSGRNITFLHVIGWHAGGLAYMHHVLTGKSILLL